MVSCGPDGPVAAWIGRERQGKAIIPALTLILRTRGCAWNRCRMCGYRHFRYPRGEASPGDFLRGQLAWAGERFAGRDFGLVKIFTSGSFLDPGEIPLETRREILHAFRGREIVIETRPGFVTDEAIRGCMEELDPGAGAVSFTVAMGLETSDDGIREKCIDKGFSLADFLAASRTARRAGAGV